VEPELIGRARQGDHDAFEQIAKSAVGRLYGTASLILRDREAAADAVQDTLIAAWQNLPLLRDPEAFDGWLNRILVRNCYRAVRSRAPSARGAGEGDRRARALARRQGRHARPDR